MAPTFEEILQSDQFTFLVGEERKPIVVHAAAIAATSEPMDRLINGGMSEAETRRAEFAEVQVEDFIRFCEYAYRGDYTVPKWEIEESPRAAGETSSWGFVNGNANPEPQTEALGEEYIKTQEPVDDAPPASELIVDDSWDRPLFATKKKGKKGYTSEPLPPPPSKIRILRHHLHKRKYLVNGGPGAAIRSQFVPSTNTDATQNFAPVFLAHSRLYSFASMHMIAPLKALTLHKLQQTLKDFTLYTDRVVDVIDLASYAYSPDYTDDRKEDGTVDELRKLVVEYIACEIDIIGKSKEFVELMEGGGQFVGDFWSVARQYLI